MTEDQMMDQFTACVRDTCEAELVACMSEIDGEKCLTELGCIGRCSTMSAPKAAEGSKPQRLPPNKVMLPPLRPSSLLLIRVRQRGISRSTGVSMAVLAARGAGLWWFR